MVRLSHERVLLISDNDRQVQTALLQSMPGLQVTSVATYFDAIAELSTNPYTTVLASTEPIERRPEAAMKTLRHLSGQGRILLFGHPTLEPLSRKMLDFGCDDYVITPVNPAELQQLFGSPPMRIAQSDPTSTTTSPVEPIVSSTPTRLSMLMGMPLADLLLDAMLQNPNNAPIAAVRQINSQIAPTMQLHFAPTGTEAPLVPDGMMLISHAVRSTADPVGTLHLLIPRDEEEPSARHFLSQLSHLVARIVALQDRHNRLQTLAITDDLTGVYNGRYFKHYLSQIIEKARALRFPVTLLLFDIDNFKKYNDLFGHSMGDEILKQTASLMKRCTREHDLVARIGGDEFAVIFWEKEGPRQPRSGEAHDPATVPGRPPQTPRQILDRFQRLLATQQFPGLGSAGEGTLTISGGLAVFPYDAADMQSLIQEADKRLTFGAKRGGKNSIFLVGTEEHPKSPPSI